MLQQLPSTILCVGRNYVAHAKELGNVPNFGEPFFFLKPLSSIIVPPHPIRIPPGAVIHHEVEVAIVLGSKAHRIKSETEAMKCVAGYRMAIDITARNWQDDAKSKGLPWTKAKGCDTFLPCGPFVTKDKVQVDNAVMRLLVNNVEKQHDSTSLMIHNVPKLLMFASAYMTLVPGDFLLTGTPKGVGQLSKGDTVTIEGLGTSTTFDVKDWE